MYDASVPVFDEKLSDLAGIVKKSAAWFQGQGVDLEAVAATRLYPNMLPLAAQAGAACRFPVIVTSGLMGVKPELERFAPLEELGAFERFSAWLEASRAMLAGLTPEQFEGAEGRVVQFPIKGAPCTFSGRAFLFRFGLPNFFFHATTFYALLRSLGVPIGKSDFVLPEFTGSACHFD